MTVALFLEMSRPCKNVSTLSNLVQFVFLWITTISSNALNIVSITSETHLVPENLQEHSDHWSVGFLLVCLSTGLNTFSTHLSNMAAAYEERIHLELSVALLL